jgi:hypothetical protein
LKQLPARQRHARVLARGTAERRAARWARANARKAGDTGHRATRSDRLPPAALVQLLAAGVAVAALLVWAQAPLLQIWTEWILEWSKVLHIPLRASPESGGVFDWSAADDDSPLPNRATFVGTGIGVVLAYASTHLMGDPLTPVKYLVRILCAVQVSALLFFYFVPSMFPYSIGGHLTSMLNSGYAIMVAVTVLMVLAYGALRVPPAWQFAHISFVAGYFALMVPHHVLVHALLLQHFSVLVMPLLYLCFGTVFHVLVFVALFSWLLSVVRLREVV